jgi:hypothetical protein
VPLDVLLSLTVARMLPVAIAMLGTRSRPATVAYLSLFGPRGLASIVFAVLVVEASGPHANTIIDATALTVTASVVLHGLSAGVLTDRYARRFGGGHDRPGSRSRPPASACQPRAAGAGLRDCDRLTANDLSSHPAARRRCNAICARANRGW